MMDHSNPETQIQIPTKYFMSECYKLYLGFMFWCNSRTNKLVYFSAVPYFVFVAMVTNIKYCIVNGSFRASSEYIACDFVPVFSEYESLNHQSSASLYHMQHAFQIAYSGFLSRFVQTISLFRILL